MKRSAIVVRAVAAVILIGLVWPVSATGTWEENGNRVCTAAGKQCYPCVVSDDSGGAIIAWEGSPTAWPRICAQRMGEAGTLLWGEGGSVLSPGTADQHNPGATTDGRGGAIVAWEQSGTWGRGDIYARRVNGSGESPWGQEQGAISTADGTQYNFVLTTDGDAGAIVAWCDNRNSVDQDVYVQRVDALGRVMWTTDGVLLCAAKGDQLVPGIVSDGNGGAIITWVDGRSGTYSIYAQRVDQLGNALWTIDGIRVCAAMVVQFGPQIVSDGAGGAMITWTDYRASSIYGDIYAQRVSPSGGVLWNTQGVPICTAAGHQAAPIITYDDKHGVFFVMWEDIRGGTHEDIYAQCVDASGNVLWVKDGIPICTVAGGKAWSKMIGDGVGGAIVTWQDSRRGTNDIYAQRVDAAGRLKWKTDGAPVCLADGNQYGPNICSDGKSGAFIVWQDNRSGNETESSRVYAQHIDAQGEVWTPVVMAAVDFDPKTLNLKSNGRWVTCYIELPEGYNVADIDIASVVLNGSVHAEASPQAVGDHDTDGTADLMVKFDRSDVGAVLFPGQEVAVTVTGYVGEARFSGTDFIRVINPPNSKNQRSDALPHAEEVSLEAGPNPFNPSVRIEYGVPAPARVVVQVWGIDGRLVRTLEDVERPKGFYTVEWNGRDGVGGELSSGLYICRLVVGDQVITRKLTLLK